MEFCVSIDEALVLECARELIQAPSENPPGDERAVAAAAERWCREAGLDTELVETAPNRVNVLATIDSGKPGRTLAWNGHLDVVPIVDENAWKHPPFDAHVENGILHGRGSADMKGGCAAAIAAAATLAQNGGPASGKLVLQLVADEEVLGPHGTQALYERGRAGADAVIIGEPTDLDVAIAERGMLWVIARTHGVAGHGSQPHLAKSAIEEMAKVVLALRGQTWDRTHPLLGTPSVNIGTVSGGSKINIVPAECHIEIDRRSLPGETPESIIQQMHQVIRAAGAQADLEIIRWAEACEIGPDEEIVRLALAEHENVRLKPGKIAPMVATTDAHVLLGMAKIPTIIFGPGALSQAHTTTEHVAVEELYDASRIYARMFASFLSA
ncbi:MAG: M20 family metallopeptidase [Actinomycetota bacterium]